MNHDGGAEQLIVELAHVSEARLAVAVVGCVATVREQQREEHARQRNRELAAIQQRRANQPACMTNA